MAKDLLSRYVWLVDIIGRYKRISRSEIDRLWSKSPFSLHGEGLPRRTFYNYRQAIEEIFGIEINYDGKSFEYYIDEKPGDNGSITGWLLNSVATNNVLNDSREIASRIFLEDVPSAREFLHIVMKAIKNNNVLQFDYSPYTRTSPTHDVTLEPYFMNLSKQRWYVTGRSTEDSKIKTYALDRMLKARIIPEIFRIPADFDPAVYIRDSFGVIFSQGKIYDVVLKVNQRRSKYLRTLPLHHSQREEINEKWSYFKYRLRITPDFVSEILSFGSDVTVIAPAELKAMIIESLKTSIANYE